MTHGEKLERIRLLSGMKQTDIAKRLRVTQQRYSQWMKQPVLNEETLEKILTELNTSRQDFDNLDHHPFGIHHSYSHDTAVGNSGNVINLTINGIDEQGLDKLLGLLSRSKHVDVSFNKETSTREEGK